MGNIILIGMPCAGKTTIGEKLAGKLNFRHIDTDRIIEDLENQNINNIIKNKGEQYFRNLEREITDNLLDEKINNTIISVGGGLPVYYDNFTKLKSIGTTIFLDATLSTLKNRYLNNINIEKKKGNRIEDFDYLYSKRRNIYSNADYIVNVTEMTECEIVNYIITHIINLINQKSIEAVLC